jgi:transcriptional regulator with XRE-family HTH domain
LDRELVRRGWSAKDLADAAGCSPGTISSARHGRALTSSTVAKIARALRDAPIVKGIDELLGADGVGMDGWRAKRQPAADPRGDGRAANSSRRRGRTGERASTTR